MAAVPFAFNRSMSFVDLPPKYFWRWFVLRQKSSRVGLAAVTAYSPANDGLPLLQAIFRPLVRYCT